MSENIEKVNTENTKSEPENNTSDNTDIKNEMNTEEGEYRLTKEEIPDNSFEDNTEETHEEVRFANPAVEPNPETNTVENSAEDKSFNEFHKENTKKTRNRALASAGLALLVFCSATTGGFLGLKIAANQQTIKNMEQYKISTVELSNDGVDGLNNVSGIVSEVMPSIVSITSISEVNRIFGPNVETYETPSSGSGVIYSKTDSDLFIITNYHVIEGASSVSIGWFDGTTSKAEVYGYSENDDLALIKVSLQDIPDVTASNLKIAVFGDSDSLEVGEGTIAIGNALGYGSTVTDGIISALNREITYEDGHSMYMIQTNAAINPGNSGGALLNSKGEIIGINSAKLADTSVEGMGYAIPSNTVCEVAKSILEGTIDENSDDTITLGISGYDVTDSMARIYNMPTGVCVQEVEPGTPADEAKLMAGDIITGVNDLRVTSMTQLKSILEGLKTGDSITIKVQRQVDGAYTEQTLTVNF